MVRKPVGKRKIHFSVRCGLRAQINSTKILIIDPFFIGEWDSSLIFFYLKFFFIDIRERNLVQKFTNKKQNKYISKI